MASDWYDFHKFDCSIIFYIKFVRIIYRYSFFDLIIKIK